MARKRTTIKYMESRGKPLCITTINRANLELENCLVITRYLVASFQQMLSRKTSSSPYRIRNSFRMEITIKSQMKRPTSERWHSRWFPSENNQLSSRPPRRVSQKLVYSFVFGSLTPFSMSENTWKWWVRKVALGGINIPFYLTSQSLHAFIYLVLKHV